jgi:cinnamoyl-CoA reductase
MGTVLHRRRLVQMLKELFPQYPVTHQYHDDGKPMARPYKVSNHRLMELGLRQLTDIRTSLYEAVISMQHKGHVPIILPHQNSSL